jgi:hypothetical protein
LLTIGLLAQAFEPCGKLCRVLATPPIDFFQVSVQRAFAFFRACSRQVGSIRRLERDRHGGAQLAGDPPLRAGEGKLVDPSR